MVATSGSLVLVFETALNVPVIDICTPVFAWGTATLFANGNAVFQLFGFRAQGCARCLFLGIFALPLLLFVLVGRMLVTSMLDENLSRVTLYVARLRPNGEKG